MSKYRVVTNGHKFRVQQRVWCFCITLTLYDIRHRPRTFDSAEQAAEWIRMVEKIAAEEAGPWKPVKGQQ